MDSAIKSPWYRLHWLTWLVFVVVMGGLAYREMEERCGMETRLAGPGSLYEDWSYFGWPWAHLEKKESGTYVLPGTLFPRSSDYHWHLVALGFNHLICLLILSATCFTCESWLRGRHRFQFSLRVLVIFIAVVAVLLGFLVNQPIPLEDEPTNEEGEPINWVHSSFVSWDDFRFPSHWPVLVAVACTIYSGVWLTRIATLHGWNLLRSAYKPR